MSTLKSFEKSEMQSELYSIISNPSHPFHKCYQKIASEIRENNKEFSDDLVKICSVYLTKKMVEEEYFHKEEEKVEEKRVDKLLEISMNDMFTHFKEVKLYEFFRAFRSISSKKKFSSSISEDLNNLITYYAFMSNLYEKFKKNFDSYFENFLTKIKKYDIYFKTAWVIFAYFKKIVLQRKSNYDESSSVIICIMSLFKDVFTAWINKFYIDYNKAFLGSLESYGKDMYINNYEKCREIKNEMYNLIRKVIGIAEENLDSLIFQFFPENMEKKFMLFSNAYREKSFSDEICDIKILSDYQTNSSTNIFEAIRSPLLKITNHNSQITSFSPFNIFKKNDKLCNTILPGQVISITVSKNEELSSFIRGLTHYFEHDIEYLYTKFNIVSSKKEGEPSKFNFDTIITDIKEKLFPDISFFSDKTFNLYLKAFYLVFSEELFKQGKSNFQIEDFIILLGDSSFHYNMMIIVSYVFLNIFLDNYLLFNLDLKQINEYSLPKITMNFMENLNGLRVFSVFSSLKITTNLLKLKIPSEVIDILKSYYIWLITYVTWQKDSSSLNILLNNQGVIQESSTIKDFVKKIYYYIANIIFRLSVNLQLDYLTREKVWMMMKFILSSELTIMKDQFIDNLIISSFYAVIKLTGSDNCNFNNIISEYSKINKSINQLNLKVLIGDIRINGKKLDIIEMYNEAYIPQLKDFLAKLKDLNMRDYSKVKLYDIKFPYFTYENNLSDNLPIIHNEYNTIFSNSPYISNIKSTNTICNSNDLLGSKRIRALTPTKNSFSANTPFSSTTFSPFRFIQEHKFFKPKVNMKKITFDSCFAENSMIMNSSNNFEEKEESEKKIAKNDY